MSALLRNRFVWIVAGLMVVLAAGGWYADQWRTETDLHDMAELLPRLPVGVAVPRTTS